MQKFPLFSTVILTKDFPQYQFMKGDVATVVEFIEPSGYILEVFDSQGDTKNVVAVLESDIDFMRSPILSNSERQYHEKVIAKGGKRLKTLKNLWRIFRKVVKIKS